MIKDRVGGHEQDKLGVRDGLIKDRVGVSRVS